MHHRLHSRILACCGAFLAAMVATWGSAAAPLTILDTADPRPHQVHQLHDQISLANLILGLNLTGEQLDDLAELTARADQTRARYEQPHVAQLEEMDVSFTDLRHHLLTSGDVPPPIKARARAAETDFKELRLDLQQELADLEAEVRQLLDDGQVQIIEEFVPCLFPPEDLSTPLRVGQAGASSHLVSKLDEIRQLPQNTYERHLPKFLDRAMERLQWHEGPIPEADEQAERERVVALIEEIRLMDDLAWALEGKRMAEELIEPFRRESASSTPRSELTKVGLLLLAPGASEVIGAIASRD